MIHQARLWGSSRIAFAIHLSFLLLLSLALPMFAHDPYEITSTIRIETNRMAVVIELEFSAAMLLTGLPRTQQPAEQAELFEANLVALKTQAGQFFEIRSGDAVLRATSTNVTLGVENHVRFDLVYPPVTSGLELNATGLKSLGEHGPFGTTVTVLDMVHKKVLGQPVLFAASPSAEIAMVAALEPGPIMDSNARPVPVSEPAAESSKDNEREPKSSGKPWLWFVVAIVVMSAVLLGLRRRRQGNQ